MDGTVRGFSVATRCETVEEFVATFHDRCDERSIIVNVVEPRMVGTECAFALLLANKKPVLAGTCVVLALYTDANNPFKRRGMRLGINRLGIESERVFVELTTARLAAAKRKSTELGMRAISPRPTMALPIVTTDIPVGDAVVIAASPPDSAIATTDGAPVAVPRKLTQPMRPLVRTPKDDSRTVRATPMAPTKPITETRTPGSSYVLPANPFTDLPDASLDGFVECRLFEASSSVDPDPAQTPTRFPRGTLDEPVAETIEDAPTNPVEMPLAVARELRRDDLGDLERESIEPLPPPPVVHAAAAPLASKVEPSRRRFALIAGASLLAMVAILGAAGASASHMTPSAPTLEPAVAISADDMTVRGTERSEAAPPAPAMPMQPLHAVLIKTYPSSAAVTIGDQSFGTTPTYVKIPANTPVEIQIVRAGYKPVTRMVTSKRRYDQMFVPLRPQSKRWRKTPVPAAVKREPGPTNLSNL